MSSHLPVAFVSTSPHLHYEERRSTGRGKEPEGPSNTIQTLRQLPVLSFHLVQAITTPLVLEVVGGVNPYEMARSIQKQPATNKRKNGMESVAPAAVAPVEDTAVGKRGRAVDVLVRHVRMQKWFTHAKMAYSCKNSLLMKKLLTHAKLAYAQLILEAGRIRPRTDALVRVSNMQELCGVVEAMHSFVDGIEKSIFSCFHQETLLALRHPSALTAIPNKHVRALVWSNTKELPAHQSHARKKHY